MISIAGRKIGQCSRPYLVAEMSGNHNKSLERALAIVEAAARAGADALKLQTYTADTMTIKSDAPGFVIEDPVSLWHGRQLHELYDEAHTPWEWHSAIMEKAASYGMHCFSTPFDDTAVDFLESLEVPAYKIASFECTDLPLIRRVAATGKPMLISLGMASLAEAGEAVQAARDSGCTQLVLLKCTSTYPSTPENTNVATIPHLRKAFGCEVGLSDHTMGCGAAVAAVAFGAVLVEKHFTTRRAEGGVDAAFSLEPEEFHVLRVETERAWQSIGSVQYGVSASEKQSLQFRRSLYVVKDLSAGDILSADNVRAIRPGFGLPPKHLGELIGRQVAKAMRRGTPLSWDLLR